MKNIPDDYVRMEQHICEVCGIQHTHNTGILLSRTLQSIKPEHTVTGYGLCKEHDDLYQQGYIALVVIDPAKSNTRTGNVRLEGAYRTGAIAHLRREIADKVFNIPIDLKLPMVFVEEEVISKLQEMQNQSIEE